MEGTPDRYNLDGCKIVEKKIFIDHFVNVFKNDSFFRVVVASKLGEAFCSLLMKAAEKIFACAVTDGLIHRNKDVTESFIDGEFKADRELYHHEFEHNRAGYSLKEACEVRCHPYVTTVNNCCL